MAVQGKQAVKINNIVITVAVIGTVILLNVLGQWVYGIWDLTDTKRYTLSDVSVKAVRALPGLQVNVYISPDLPPTINLGYGRELDLRGLKQAFLDKLRQYQAVSNGKMKIRIITKDVAKRAKDAKLRLFAGQKAQIEGGRLEFKKYAFGATFQYKNQVEVYPLALEPDFYEYEITKRLLELKEKYKQSLVMKDVLNAGDRLYRAVKACKEKIESFKSKKNKQSLASLLSGGNDIAALRMHLKDVKKVCSKVDDALKDVKKLKGKQENLDDEIKSATNFMKLVNRLYQTLSDTSKTAQAGAIIGAIKASFNDVDEDHTALKNSPGRHSIGFVCGHYEFCPFPEDKPLINPTVGALLGQKNPMTARFIDEAKNLEQRINMINDQINRALFRRKGFNLKKITKNSKITPDVKALVVYNPRKPLDDKTLYKIDQFLLHGHSVVFFVPNWDVAVYNIKPGTSPDGRDMSFNELHRRALNTNVADFLANYGIKLNKDIVVGKKHFADITVYGIIRQGQYTFQTQRAFSYPLLPTFFNFDSKNPIVRGIADLTLPFVSTVEPSKAIEGKKDVKVTALVSTNKEDAAVKGDIPLSPPLLVSKLPVLKSNGPKPVALLVTGHFTSYFANRPRPEGEDKDPNFVKEGHGRILVIGSNLGLENLSPQRVFEGFSMSQLSANNFSLILQLPKYLANFQNWQLRLSQIAPVIQQALPFLSNVLDWAIQKESLAEIRAKGFVRRPIAEVSKSTQVTIMLLLILGLPVLFILFGLFRYIARKSRLGGAR